MSDTSSTPRNAPLPPERWSQVLRIFHDAVERPLDERTAFLRDACSGDQALCRQVEALLDADREDSLLRTGGGWTEWSADRGSMTGTQIGPYHVHEELGRGGMGVVYRARRTDVETTVALKFLRERFPSASRLQRFLDERRTLGQLVHAGIARFLDAGMTDDGTPFFVMEYVDGVPITDYCDTHGLDVEARLRLFQQVCRAVRYAHRNLVVHRDLKPSNVLVTEGGEVKLLDFGIAKLLDGKDERETGAATHTGPCLFTPAYAAPEQVQGEAVSTATDVYALGTVLYELLAGQRPVDVTGATWAEAAQRILHEMPAAPSQVAQRTASPAVPAAALRGDLDVICRAALRKDPERRYASAEAFCGDIQRVLENLPITARPDTVAYRAGKFLRRHRMGVLAALAAGLLLMSLAAFHTVRLAQERDYAEQQAATAESVVAFLVETLEDGDPNAAPGDTLTVHDVVDRAEDRAESLRDRPLVQASILDAIGRVRLMHSDVARADSLFEASLQIRQAELPPGHPDVTTSLNHLAEAHALRGRYRSADSLLQTSIAIRHRAHGPSAPETTAPAKLLAKVRYRTGQYAQADSLYRQVFAIHDRTQALSDEALADAHQEWGMVQFRMGDYAAAAEQFQRVVTLFRAWYPEGHSGTASALANLASVERVRGNYEAAAKGYQEALVLTHDIMGARHLNAAIIQNNLAVTYHRQGKVEEAAGLMRENLGLRQELLGPTHPAVATAHNNLGEMLRDLGQLQEAASHFRNALHIREDALGLEHEKTVTTLNNIAKLHDDRGEYEVAEALRRDVLDRYRAALGPEHPRVALALANLGATLRQAGKLEEALQHLTEALALRREVLPAGHDDVAQSLEQLGALHEARGQWTRAEEAYREAVDLRSASTPGHWKTHRAKARLGHSLVKQRRYASAEPYLLSGYAGLADQRGPKHPAVQHGRAALGDLYTMWQRPDRAKAVRDSLMRAEVLPLGQPQVETATW